MISWFLAIIGLLSGMVALANKVWPTNSQSEDQRLNDNKQTQDETIRSWINHVDSNQ